MARQAKKRGTAAAEVAEAKVFMTGRSQAEIEQQQERDHYHRGASTLNQNFHYRLRPDR